MIFGINLSTSHQRDGLSNLLVYLEYAQMPWMLLNILDGFPLQFYGTTRGMSTG